MNYFKYRSLPIVVIDSYIVVNFAKIVLWRTYAKSK